MPDSSTYIPGTCNIGPSEIKRRQSVALLGFIATVITGILFVSSHVSPLLRVSAFIPAMIFATGWVQSRRKFCLAFGLMGTFNFGKAGQLSKVQSPEDLAADKATALSILRQAALLAAVITGLIIVLPR
jgi:hypothetical protein